MSLNHPSSGEYFSPAYQISSLPYLTSSVITQGEIHKYEFPFVTKFINIVNRSISASGKIAISFTERGLRQDVGNYITLDQSDTVHEEIRTTILFVSCSAGIDVDYQIFCGLTTIPAKNFLIITGSNGHSGVG